MEEPEFLYKYQALNVNTLTALKSGSLWFSGISMLNDPFERVFGYEPHVVFAQSNLFNNLSVSLRETIEAAGVCSFTSLSPENAESFKSSSLMWSHYAGQFSGVCIEFSTKELLSSFYDNQRYLLHGKPMQYLDVPYRIGSEPIFSTEELLFKKHSAWSYEYEFRVISLYYKGLVPYSTKAIKKIYVGGRMPAEQISLLKLVVQSVNPHVEILIAKTVDEGYGFFFEEI